MEEKTVNKKQLIYLLAEVYLIDRSVVLEMWDICETQSVVIEHQEWLESNKELPDQENSLILQELDKSMKSMEQSAIDLINLG